MIGALPVAPYTGAWIEMSKTSCTATVLSSLLIQERGLKYHLRLMHTVSMQVAPYTGAWIEIKDC